MITLINWMQLHMWWIENPRLGKLHRCKFMQKMSSIDVDYCMFCEYGYRKPTDFRVSTRIAAERRNILCDRQCPIIEWEEQYVTTELRLAGALASSQRGKRLTASRQGQALISSLSNQLQV